jgi:hypothetical protein
MCELRWIWSGLLACATTVAFASVDPACEGKTQRFDDQGQQNFLLNYFALSTTFSALHGPMPTQPGTGSVSLEMGVIPPLSCERRLVLNDSKTEDTNKAPVFPRPRIHFTFPQVGPLVLYGGAAYVPPVTVFETRNVIVSGEFGAAYPLDMGLQFGLRGHATLMKTIAEIATPFTEGEEAYDDFYMGSTFGLEASVGYVIYDDVTPYIHVGFTDVSTYFYIGDDAYVAENSEPFFGFTGSAGVQATLWEHFDVAGEFYTAPGVLYTGRLRVGYVF